jgi:transcriptional regulator with XRE-family HTH domain
MDWSQDAFAERLEFALRHRGWNQRKLAKHLGVAGATVSGWKRTGKSTPSVRDLVAIAECLSVTPCWLAFGDEHAPMTEKDIATMAVLRHLSDEERAATISFLSVIAKSRQP